ncbi:hypothetical protein [Clostridium sp. BL-8]|uniref:hypothetical protein n=1 Tax=Clostridium sp. BL-8 TaxID=349938 RepID=UPI00098CCC66|nr:hypothetical protein [Clostridium sp. BL-8]OOM76589.1 hypothetical protein CLOBL_34740 [Clostridium sp. BL-8]
MLKDELFLKRDNDKKNDIKICKNYNFLKYSNDIAELQKLKYKCIFKAKKLRDWSTLSGAIVLISTVLIALITMMYSVLNTMSSDGQKEIQSISANIINTKIAEINNKEGNDIDETKKEVLETIKSEKDNVLEIIKKNTDFIGYLSKIIFVVIISIIIFYASLVRVISHKASDYETLVIMIEERIKEIKQEDHEKIII